MTAGRLFLGFLKLVLLSVLAGALGAAFWLCAQVMSVQAGMVLAVVAAWLACGVLALLRRGEAEPERAQRAEVLVGGWRQGTPATWGQHVTADEAAQE